MTFDDTFKALTGYEPFPWQEELFKKFSQGEIPPSCNLPTGLGKTNVMAIWLIALARGEGNLPRRLAYVVNRRTVVDQATDEAKKLRDNVGKAGLTQSLKELCAFEHDVPLAISTLRGQFADNGEWAADPARPAIIVGTVDMIGSRLLFSGYRIGYKRKPLHAGFLGHDTLLVHDEAHLEPAFSRLLWRVEREQRCNEKSAVNLGRSIYVMELSATSRVESCDDRELVITRRPHVCKCPLELNEADRNEQLVKDRLYAVKRLKLEPAKESGKKVLAETIAEHAKEHDNKRCRVLIYVWTPDTALAVAEFLQKKLKLSEEETRQRIGLLTGTLRGYERDKLAESDLFKSFASDPNRPRQLEQTLYLVSTSAGEVGVDLDADHLVCDVTTLDSMIQRFGRVNRLGGGDRAAEITVVWDADKQNKSAKKKPKKISALDDAVARTRKILQRVADNGGDVSPDTLCRMLESQETQEAFSLAPKMLIATDILFDAWAMTSITDDMPGRPEVAPYLHGVADDLPQTTIAWRAELDLIDTKAPDAEKTLQAIFTKHRIRPHETITINRYYATKFLKELTGKKRPDLRDTHVALIFARKLMLTKIGSLVDNPGPLNADPTLILPATFGGLDEKGMLSAKTIRSDQKAEESSPAPAPDIADCDGYEMKPDVPTRQRVLIERADNGWKLQPLSGGKPLPDAILPDGIYKKSRDLINDVAHKTGLKVRLVQSITFDEEGDPIKSLVALSPVLNRRHKQEQLLHEHIEYVEREAQRLAKALKLSEPFRSALLFAAKWHDEGKNATIWQRYIGGERNQPLGKSAKWRDPKILAGYRHEFGSLMQITDSDRRPAACGVPDNSEVWNLALHMIAAHHGRARPHFPMSEVFDPGPSAVDVEALAIEIPRRFARLQRKYGRWGLAYLESLLRAADWAVSGDMDTEDDLKDANGDNT